MYDCDDLMYFGWTVSFGLTRQFSLCNTALNWHSYLLYYKTNSCHSESHCRRIKVGTSMLNGTLGPGSRVPGPESVSGWK